MWILHLSLFWEYRLSVKCFAYGKEPSTNLNYVHTSAKRMTLELRKILKSWKCIEKYIDLMINIIHRE